VAELAPSAWLELIIAKAKELRAAGVTSVSINGVAITLAPPDPVAPPTQTTPRTEPAPMVVDMLDDPSTYGGAVPGFTRPAKRKDAQ
jgi:hypothetical protein